MSASENETKRERRERARGERREREQAEAAAALRKKRLGQLGGVGIGVVAIVIVAVALLANGSTKSKIKTSKVADTVVVGGKAVSVPGSSYVKNLFAGIPESGATLGSPKAPVTMDEFADLQCPFCQAYSLNALPDLVTQYVRTGKVRMVFHNLTFLGPDSVRAGLVAQAAAKQNKLWPFIELWYENQQEENTGYATDPFITKIATGAGLNVPEALADRSASFAQGNLDAASNLASAHAIDSTPSFLLSQSGGTPQAFQPTALNTAAFTGALNQELGKAG
jgi:protein-disulfide isomerase